VKSLTKDLKIERKAWENAQAETRLYYDVVRRFTGLQCEHIGKLEARGQLAKRVPESLRQQVESAVERAYYEMRAEDGSVAARNRLDQLSAAALEGKDIDVIEHSTGRPSRRRGLKFARPRDCTRAVRRPDFKMF